MGQRLRMPSQVDRSATARTHKGGRILHDILYCVLYCPSLSNSHWTLWPSSISHCVFSTYYWIIIGEAISRVEPLVDFSAPLPRYDRPDPWQLDHSHLFFAQADHRTLWSCCCSSNTALTSRSRTWYVVPVNRSWWSNCLYYCIVYMIYSVGFHVSNSASSFRSALNGSCR